ncbi:MAG: hypothetical protein KJI69_00895 [Patescibacteria group bacterium]|nr:hypothetical protein [Patescibacteria group bacterium]
MTKEVVNLKNARKGEYEKVIAKIQSRGKCPFCKENFKYHKNPILKRKEGWFITKNSWPYKNTNHHFIILNFTHKETLLELTTKDLQTILGLAKWAVREYKIKGGLFMGRFGKTSVTGASVTHLHFHLFSPKKDKKTKRTKKVSLSIGG